MAMAKRGGEIMGRILKFRVWDKELSSFGVECEYQGGTFGLIQKQLEIQRTPKERLFSSAKDYEKFCEKNFVAQQFTGKTDEQNVDIYEGDIVYLNHYDVPEVDKQCLFEIIFEDGAFKLKPIKLGQAPNGGVSGFFWMRFIEGEDSSGDTIYRYELPPPQPICGFNRMVVIGNIFENPELVGN